MAKQVERASRVKSIFSFFSYFKTFANKQQTSMLLEMDKRQTYT